LLVLPLLGPSGCTAGKPGLGTVTGRVTYRGQPVTGGSITFVAAPAAAGEGRYTFGVDAHGSYFASQLPVGVFHIAIETESAKNRGNPADMLKKMRPPPGVQVPAVLTPSPEAAANMPRYMKLPARYAKAETSGLSLTVAEGRQRMDFDLK
jgi:hypothetical protein